MTLVLAHAVIFSHDLQNLCSSESSGKMGQGTEQSHGQDAAWWHKGEESEWGTVFSGIPESHLSIKKWGLCFRICSGLVSVAPVSGVGVKLLLVQLGLQRLRGSWTVPSPKHPQPGFGLSLHLPQVGIIAWQGESPNHFHLRIAASHQDLAFSLSRSADATSLLVKDQGSQTSL